MENQQTSTPETTPLTIREKRALLASMIRGHRKTKRYVKVKDRIVELEEGLTATQILRALALDEKLAKQQRAEEAAQQQQSPAKPAPVAPTTAAVQATAPAPAITTTTPPKPPLAGAPKPLSKKQRKKMAGRAAV